MKNTQFVPDTPPDAPPEYGTINPGPSQAAAASTQAAGSNSKAPLNARLDTLAGLYTPQPALETAPLPGEPAEQGWVSWADYVTWGGMMQAFKKKQKQDETRATMRSLIHDTLKNLSDPGALEVLHSCQAACRAHALPFEQLIQEDVEGHTPLYWSILAVCHLPSAQGTPRPSYDNGVGNDILELLLSVPLEDRTIADARSALMLNNANSLFQALRTYPTFEKTSYAETVIGLRGPTTPTLPSGSTPGRVSIVQVEEISDTGVGTFRVGWEIPMWCKRVKVARKVTVQWIARGRGWQCSASIKEGHWVIGIKLLKNSASTPITGVLRLGPLDAKEKVELKYQRRKMETKDHTYDIRLDSVLGGATLEYEDSPYLTPEGTLYVQGEFVLEKKDTRDF
ncbi:hypothetical protein DACRYDRAFT_108242 [Dacryopinax primogenitus]|uniref:Uncharacterized protein n=1 Tax=Dacryopinax primogenitus (strain DJM 731) TaxID=1858805 RepID=M5G4V2_DACPD|nr:uncharacterized protein DACRYDRAFT_108242 [Dacryopinax primogenitus]EJU00887.1 hypothetical protein DACRYDRAFT_108242 [Dacryopinax primogenitus]